MKLDRSDLQLETIVRRIRDDELDLQPDFQRGEIWDNKRRQRLVDTILRSWYVPPIHVVVDSEGNEEVLDGQQRLAAVRDFFADKIKVDGFAEPRDERILALDGLRYSKLPEEVRRAVNRFVISVITLDEYEPQEPNELFFRLNQSYNLTPPEKRNALHGEARDQVRELVNSLVEVKLLESSRIGFSNGRLAYDDIIARSCVAIEIGDMRKHINNDVVEDQYRTAPFSVRTIELVRDAGLRLLELIDSAPGRIKFNKGTLQTWLVYSVWAPIDTGPIPDGLLSAFEAARHEVRAGGLSSPIGAVLALYDDRASYRVTDVSSVLIRDLAVHLFSEHEFGTGAKRRSEQLLARIVDGTSQSPQTLVGEYLEESKWGFPIIDHGDNQ
jgi:hypothetical protein